jgi:hypothetical protein
MGSCSANHTTGVSVYVSVSASARIIVQIYFIINLSNKIKIKVVHSAPNILFLVCLLIYLHQQGYLMDLFFVYIP